MKALLSIFVLAVFTSAATAQEATKTKEKPKTQKSSKPAKAAKLPVTFKTLVIDRPNIAYGADETFSFEFKNTGNVPVTISNVQTSCGCTTASKPEQPVAPGKSSVISVKYDTKRVGEFTKTITVTTNVQPEPIVLTIKGKVAPQPTEN